MANRLYRKYLHALATGTAVNLSTATLKFVLVDSATYTPDTTITGHEFLSDIVSGARLATTAALSSVTVTDAGLDAADPAIPDAGGGATAEYAVLYVDTGAAATSRLLALFDTATGLPLTLDGTNDTLQINASGIFKL